MKLLLRIFKIIAIVIIFLFVALVSVTLIKQDKVAELFLNELNNKVNTKFEVGSLRLSLFRKFPMASFEFKNILIHSSPGFKNNQFPEVNTDTLLYARTLSLEFKMTDIYNGRYIIESINMVNGKLSLLTDSVGHSNYEITNESSDSTGNEFALNLKKIGLSDVDLFYSNKSLSLKISSIVKSARLRGEIAGNNIDLYAKSDAKITNFQLYEASVTHPTEIKAEINMHKSDSGIVIKKGTLSFENIALALSGTISDKDILDLTLTGQSSDISGLKNYISGKYLALFNDYKPSGILKVDCSITGLLSRKVTPHIDINFSINKGLIEYTRSKISASDIAFSGSFNNGSRNNPETSNLTVKDLTFKIGTSNYSGSLTLSNFLNPQVGLSMSGDLVFSDLKDFISLPQISSSEGSIGVTMNLSGNFDFKDKYSFSDLMKLNPDASFTFNSFDIGLNKEKFKIDDIEGNIQYKKNVLANNLFITYKEQRIRINGEFINLPEWLNGEPVVLKAIADVSFNKLIPSTFLEKDNNKGTGTQISKSYTFPKDIILDLNLIIANFEYKAFTAKNISARMTYKPGLLEINNFSLAALSGNISGSCFLTQGINKSFLSKGIFDVKQININEAFKTFRNFGQTYLKAENLAGFASGSFTILSTLDSLMNPDPNSLISEGKYSIKDGELVDFDPVKELSTYIELSELEDIRFSDLENEFFIKNSILTMPQMDINSTAADFSINGKHNFSGDYEYHVKILLSEILSKKRRSSRKANTNSKEFGIVEDDGLGRTSLLLKITQKSEIVKVAYDLAAARGEIKQDFKKEKQSLKTILNEEYGLYKKDSTIKPQPVQAPQKPRFQITWDD